MFYSNLPARSIPASGSLILSANTSACALTDSQIKKVEHVQLVISLQHRHRGDLGITLISPSGTRSQLLTTRRNDHSSRGLKDWILMTVHFWGENPLGLWTLSITDNDSNNRQHFLKKARQADVEDATKTIMHDSEKFGENEKTGEYGGHFKQPASDHILKTMEDTEGRLFQVVGKFGKVKRKKSRYHKGNYAKHHWKHKPFKNHHFDGHVSGSKRFHGKGSLGEDNANVMKTKKVKYPTAKRDREVYNGKKLSSNHTKAKHLADKKNKERGKSTASDSPVLEPSNELHQTNWKDTKNYKVLHNSFRSGGTRNSQLQTENTAKLDSTLGFPGGGFKTFVSLNSRFNISLTGFTHQNSGTSRAKSRQTPFEWTLPKGMKNPLVARLFDMDLTRHKMSAKPTQSGQAFGSVRRGSGSEKGAAEQKEPGARARGTPFTSQGSKSNEVEVGIPYAGKVREKDINARVENAGSGSYEDSGSGSGDVPSGNRKPETENRKYNEKIADSNYTSSGDASKLNNENMTSNSVDYDATFSGASSGADEFVVSSGDLPSAIFESDEGETGSSARENDATAQDSEKVVVSGEASENAGAMGSADPCSFQNGGDGDSPCAETLSKDQFKRKHAAYAKNEEELAHYLATDKLRANVHSMKDGDAPKDESKIHRNNDLSTNKLGGKLENRDTPKDNSRMLGEADLATDKLRVNVDAMEKGDAPKNNSQMHHKNDLHTDKVRANVDSLQGEGTPKDDSQMHRKNDLHTDKPSEEAMQDGNAPKNNSQMHHKNDPHTDKLKANMDSLREGDAPKDNSKMHTKYDLDQFRVNMDPLKDRGTPKDSSKMHRQNNLQTDKLGPDVNPLQEGDAPKDNSKMHTKYDLSTDEFRANMDLLQDRDAPKDDSKMHRKNDLVTDQLGANLDLLQDEDFTKENSKMLPKNDLYTDQLRASVDLLLDGDAPKHNSKMHHKNDESIDENYTGQENPVLLDQDYSKLNNKDLNILEEALKEQLSRLPRTPGRSNSNFEILSRVRSDINRGDVEDLELLETQLGDKILPRAARGIRGDDFETGFDHQEVVDMDDPGVNNGVFSDQDDEGGGYENDDGFFDAIDNNRIEPRRLSRKTGAQKWTKRYHVEADKYGKGHSGILESWTLILYGTT